MMRQITRPMRCFLVSATALVWSAAPALSAPVTSGAGLGGAEKPVIMPAPASIQTDGATSPLPKTIVIRWDGKALSVLATAVERFRTRLEKLTGQPIRFVSSSADASAFTITLHCAGKDGAFPALDMPEQYALTVSASGATLDAAGPAGILHGLASLLQLAGRDATGAVITHASLNDTPRFRWRGLMIDVSRHFMSIPTLQRQIDAMEMVKLNVLHLHLSDGQGFRVESRLLPRLHTVASHGAYYTQKQIRALVTYAAERGIRVVPEFDTPGHTFALLEAYPRYAAQAPLNMEDRAEKNRAALDPTNPATYRFVTALYGEMASLFPDAYFHIGGDEVVAKQWTTSPHIQAYMKAHSFKTPAEMQAEFTTRVAQALTRRHKKVIGWDEITAADIPRDTVVEIWRGAARTAAATAAGHPVVVSDGYYLDRLQPAAIPYAQDPLGNVANMAEAEAAAQATGPGGTIADKVTTQTTPLTDAQKALVLGAEAALWTEIVTEEMLDSRLWPRMAALAERFWSPASACDGQTLYPRLAVMQDKLEELGLESSAHASQRLARLAPGETASASVLLSVTSPVRNYAHNHEFLQIRHKQRATEQDLNTLADIASPDSFAADTFNRQAAAYAAGQKDLKATLRAQLAYWVANDAAFQATAARNPALQNALPASESLKNLAQAGLMMLGYDHSSGWKHRVRAAVRKARAEIAASATTKVVTNTPQPPGDLLQDILPGIEALSARIMHGEGVAH